MPRVPTREQRVQERALSAPNASVTLPIGGMISASNRAGAVGQRLAQDAENYFISAQSKADDLRVQEVSTDFLRKQRSILKEYKKTQLNQAMDSSSYLEDLNKLYEETKGVFANERQVEKFKRGTLNSRLSFENQVQQHADNERQKYDNLLTKQAIDFEIESFLDDPSGKTADKTIMAIEDKTARYFARNGLLSEEDSQAILKILDEGGDPRDLRGRDAKSWNSLINHPKFKEARKESENRLASGIIDRAFAVGDNAAAATAFEKNRHLLTADQRKFYKKALTESGILDAAYRAYDKISKLSNPAQQHLALKQIKNSEVRKQTTALVRQGIADRKALENDLKEKLFENAFKFIDSNVGTGKTLRQILPGDMYNMMKADDIKVLNARLEKANEEKSASLFIEFNHRYSDDDLREFSAVKIKKLTSGMNKKYEAKAVKAWKDASERAVTPRDFQKKEMLTEFRNFGYTTASEFKDLDDDERALFENTVTEINNEIAVREQGLGRKLERDEQLKIVKDNMRKAQLDDWFANTRVPAAEVRRQIRSGQLEYEVKVDIDEIDPVTRAEIDAMIEAAGIAKSDYQVEKIYMMLIKGQHQKLEEYLNPAFLDADKGK